MMAPLPGLWGAWLGCPPGSAIDAPWRASGRSSPKDAHRSRKDVWEGPRPCSLTLCHFGTGIREIEAPVTTKNALCRCCYTEATAIGDGTGRALWHRAPG